MLLKIQLIWSPTNQNLLNDICFLYFWYALGPMCTATDHFVIEFESNTEWPTVYTTATMPAKSLGTLPVIYAVD